MSVIQRIIKIKFQCFFIAAGGYDFEVCPFGTNFQKQIYGTSKYNLGTWNGNQTEEMETVTLLYDNGEFCGAIGEPRSSEVKFTLGETTNVVSAAETSTCFYAFEMTCNPDDAIARKRRRMEFLPTISNSTVV